MVSRNMRSKVPNNKMHTMTLRTRPLNKINCWIHRSKVHMHQHRGQASPMDHRRHITWFNMYHIWHRIRKCIQIQFLLVESGMWSWTSRIILHLHKYINAPNEHIYILTILTTICKCKYIHHCERYIFRMSDALCCCINEKCMLISRS